MHKILEFCHSYVSEELAEWLADYFGDFLKLSCTGVTMKKYRYTLDFVTDAAISEPERHRLATTLLQVIAEAGEESGDTVYVNVCSETPVAVNDAELEQFKKDAGY